MQLAEGAREADLADGKVADVGPILSKVYDTFSGDSVYGLMKTYQALRNYNKKIVPGSGMHADACMQSYMKYAKPVKGGGVTPKSRVVDLKKFLELATARSDSPASMETSTDNYVKSLKKYLGDKFETVVPTALLRNVNQNTAILMSAAILNNDGGSKLVGYNVPVPAPSDNDKGKARYISAAVGAIHGALLSEPAIDNDDIMPVVGTPALKFKSPFDSVVREKASKYL